MKMWQIDLALEPKKFRGPKSRNAPRAALRDSGPSGSEGD